MTKSIPILLIGAGGHCKVVLETIKSKVKCKIDIYDDKKKNIQIGKKKIKIKGTFKELVDKRKLYSQIFISIGNNKIRKIYFEKIKKLSKINKYFVHLNSIISISAKIDHGTVIMANSVIQSDSHIGENCIINTAVSIDHDCKIMKNSHICPGVNIAGGVTVGQNCWIGIGTKIIENIKIGDNVFVGAGSVVTKNIKSNSFVMGVPAKNAK